MKVTIQKLGITIEDEEQTPRAAPSAAWVAACAPIPGCSNGYAVYAFRGTRTMQRVGEATCLCPSAGHSASSAGLYMTISSALSSQFSAITAPGSQAKEIRLAVCCPNPSTLVTNLVAKKECPPPRGLA